MPMLASMSSLGSSCVQAIESVNTDRSDAPLRPVKILEMVVDPELCC